MEEIITVMPPAAEIALEDFNYTIGCKGLIVEKSPAPVYPANEH